MEMLVQDLLEPIIMAREHSARKPAKRKMKEINKIKGRKLKNNRSMKITT
jgi:hypothetical protein